MTLIDPNSKIVSSFLEAKGYDPESEPLRVEGSARRYYRVQSSHGDGAAILCIETPFLPDHHDFLTVRDQLQAADVPVPSILGMEPEHGLILQTDAGTQDLEQWLASRGPGQEQELKGERLSDKEQLHGGGAEKAQGPLKQPVEPREQSAQSQHAEQLTEQDALQKYREIVDWILAMQQISPAPPVSERFFDKEKLHWEMEFLYERLEKVSLERRIDVEPSFELKMFLLEVCEALGAQKDQCFVHRDLHSRNIMIDGQSMTLIDFQDARTGNRFYDLASLVFDPYAGLAARLRKEMIDYYFEKTGLEKGRGLLYLQGLQRILKALGSYLYLGLEQGKSGYLECVPPALDQLEACLHLGRFPDSVFLFILDCRKRLLPALR
ncbi:MAG: hypothetical protein CMN76_05240 [Spirochaetaceae bacterium]|nr:hypothetical protein [Spirochaetaceae bacterium]|tara:strand:- start:67186 stop:68325 length:1140 start_codon:yes stop_codon:yes gene_type:complete